MKKLIIISSCIVVVCLIVSLGVLPSIKNNQNEIADAGDSTSSSSVNLTYIVKNFNGNIAVFEGSHEAPFKVTNVPINSLPYTDQELLKKGIMVNSKTELTKILEDYCS